MENHSSRRSFVKKSIAASIIVNPAIFAGLVRASGENPGDTTSGFDTTYGGDTTFDPWDTTYPPPTYPETALDTTLDPYDSNANNPPASPIIAYRYTLKFENLVTISGVVANGNSKAKAIAAAAKQLYTEKYPNSNSGDTVTGDPFKSYRNVEEYDVDHPDGTIDANFDTNKQEWLVVFPKDTVIQKIVKVPY